MTASDARPPSDVCACSTPGETHSPTIHARPPSDTGTTGWSAVDECERLPGCCSDEHRPECPEAPL